VDEMGMAAFPNADPTVIFAILFFQSLNSQGIHAVIEVGDQGL
jgi:hypothetical protein